MSEKARFWIEPERPYSLDLTVERLVRFPEAVDRFEDGAYRRLLPVGSGFVLVSVAQSGTPARARLRVELEGRAARSAGARRAAERLVLRSLGAGLAVRPFYRALRADTVLRGAIRRFRGLRVAGQPSVFETLVTAILAQQVNLVFAYSIRRELALSFGRRARVGGETFVAFPTARRIARESVESLRAFRLSNAKARAIHELAAVFARGEISDEKLEAMSDDDAIEQLVALRGVGRWTAEIALLRGLARPDVFPAADLAVVKYLAQGLLGRAEKAREREMRAFSERWRPHRSLALVYAYAELQHRSAARKD